MLFKERSKYFCQIEKSLMAKINKLSFSNPQAGSRCEIMAAISWHHGNENAKTLQLSHEEQQT